MQCERTTCIKIRDSFQRIICFSVVLSLVNFFGSKDKPGIDRKTEHQQCRWQDVYLSFCFPRGFLYAFTLGEQRGMCVCVCVILFVCEFGKATNHNWFEMLGTSQTGFTLRYTVLRVHAVHPCHCCGSYPRMHVFQVYKYRKYILVSFSNLNNRFTKA